MKSDLPPEEWTLRDYFIAHAPASPEPWFKPVMPACGVDPKWVGDSGREYPDRHTAERMEGDCIRDVNGPARLTWKAEWDKQWWVQWPSAWADEQLRQRAQYQLAAKLMAHKEDRRA